jgi:hypothetical protein
MKTLTILCICLFAGAACFAQETAYKIPRFEKMAIGGSGCSAYFPNDIEGNFDLSFSEDSSEVYTGDFVSGGFHFAVIVVKLNGTVLETTEDKESMITSYLDFLKGQFSVVGAVGYGMGHTLESHPAAIGVIDYWESGDGDQWAVKSWADETVVAVMMLYGATEYPNYNVQTIFLDGFRFN